MTPILSNIRFIVSGIIITAIGAFPFGLVNLSVANTASKHGINAARKIAFGATLVEIFFSLIAILTSIGILAINRNSNAWHYSTIIVLFIVSLFFFFKKSKKHEYVTISYQKGILKGIILNLISIQVLLFWFFAMLYSSTLKLIPSNFSEISFFVFGVILSKMLVLELYSIVGIRFIKGNIFIEKNINRIIGVIIFSATIIQIIKI